MISIDAVGSYQNYDDEDVNIEFVFKLDTQDEDAALDTVHSFLTDCGIDYEVTAVRPGIDKGNSE